MEGRERMSVMIEAWLYSIMTITNTYTTLSEERQQKISAHMPITKALTSSGLPDLRRSPASHWLLRICLRLARPILAHKATNVFRRRQFAQWCGW